MSPLVAGPSRSAEALTRILRRLDNYTIWAFNPPAALGGRPSARHDIAVTGRGAGTVLAEQDLRLARVSELIDSAVEHVRSLDDPAERVREVESLTGRVLSLLDSLRAEAPPAVRALRRQGLSFAEISARTGLSRERVIELCRLTRHQGW